MFILTVLFAFCLTAVLHADDTADAFFRRLGALTAMRTFHADVTMTRRLRGLEDTPLITRAELALERGGRLSWKTTAPRRTAAVIDGATVRFRDDRGRETALPLAAQPLLRPLADLFPALLAGSPDALRPLFRITATGTRDLSLEPAAALLKPLAAHLTIRFTERLDAPEHILIRDAAGNETDLRFTRIRLNDPLPASVWELP